MMNGNLTGVGSSGMLEGYELVKKMHGDDDKSIYLTLDPDKSPRVLKVFKKTYKYPIYKRLSGLTHENIPEIHGVFLDEDCFYVLEGYVEGKTLQEMLEMDGVFDRKTAIGIISQLCGALSYLHSQIPPIVHRDIKPSNIMLTADGTVKLMDFDIAREHKGSAIADTEIVGTRHFAPPEQYGFSESDQRTDIYSLGVLLTVLLTNGYHLSKIKNRIVRAIVKRCTAFDPKKRYRDVQQLQNRLELCVPLAELPLSITKIDVNTYVFPNTKLRLFRLVAPVVVMFLVFIVLIDFHPYPADGFVPFWQRTYTEVQRAVYDVIAFSTFISFIVFSLFAVNDFLKFLYLRGVQRRSLTVRTRGNSAMPPFIIASKKHLYCLMAFLSAALLILLIPHMDATSAYEIGGWATLMMILCCILSFVLRGGHYPRHYNRAIRHYYRGNKNKSVRFAKKSMKAMGKRSIFAKMWLLDILRKDIPKGEKNL